MVVTGMTGAEVTAPELAEVVADGTTTDGHPVMIAGLDGMCGAQIPWK